MKVLFFLVPILLTTSVSTYAQEDSQATITRIKQEFSRAYVFWNRIRDRTWEGTPCNWDSIPESSYFDSLSLQNIYLNGFIGLTFYSVKKVGNDLRVGDRVRAWNCPHSPIGSKNVEEFLVAIDHRDQIVFVSGDLILNEIYQYLQGEDRFLAVAQARLFYLRPDALHLRRKRSGWRIYEAHSAILSKKVRIAINPQNEDQFAIYLKGRRRNPIFNVGIRTY